MSIQRWDGAGQHDDNGIWVLHSDHERAIAEARAAALCDAVKVIHDYRADPAAPEGTVYVSDVVAAIEALGDER